jgi:major membrane immunogen (membrane-anchored lipoprotein)
MRPRTLLGISLLLTFVAASSAFADRGMTACTMKYNLKGWSAFYKTASGSGMIHCDNGQKANVKISAKGGGLTAGKTDIRDGNGSFSKVSSINDLFGRYGSASAAAAAGKGASAMALTKGHVHLALSGTGRGVELGLALGRFTITKR